MRAADALCEALKAEGVEHVFGIPGGANLPTYDALYDAELTHIQVRHEQGGGHAAEGYAKASGRVGVAFATSGPGATNLVTPIANAHMDSVPTVFITGQVRTDLIGTDGFQEADVTGITLPIVKHSFMVDDPRQIPEYVHEAFHIASTGRPGPVLLDVPQDLSRAEIDYEPTAEAPNLPGYKPSTEGNIKQIRVAAKALASANRPVIYAGGGVVNASAPFRRLMSSGSACSACTARGPRTTRWTRPTSSSRLEPALTTGSRASSRSSPPGRSSSTSTSTRPRSRRTFPLISRSLAMRSRFCPSSRPSIEPWSPIAPAWTPGGRACVPGRTSTRSAMRTLRTPRSSLSG